MSHSIELEHTTDTGHRIPGHQDGKGKCARLHGHTYRYRIMLSAETLDAGFVVDFGDVKRIVDEWDHRLLLWRNDPLLVAGMMQTKLCEYADVESGVVRTPFIPTAEHMAQHLARRFAHEFEPVHFASVTVHETPKTSATFYCTKEEARRELAWPSGAR